jgi:hypothetical protein
MSEDGDSIDEEVLQEKLQNIADLLFDIGLDEEEVDDVINDIYEKVTGEEYESDEEEDEEQEEEQEEEEEKEEKEKEIVRKSKHNDKEHNSSPSSRHQNDENKKQSNQEKSNQEQKKNELTSIISKATTKVNNHKQLDCILLSGGVQTQVYQHVLYCTSHNLDPVAIKKLISQKLKIRSAIKNDHLYLEGTHTRKELEKFYVGTLANSH